ncbi:MAG: YbaN family protein [Defluviitaleaceae bacterium]|nr:YbaN family protein [Defluviitaleaceae bacterium]
MKKTIYNTIGILSVIMGYIGIFVPVWPTTVFVIIASIMFTKANPKMYNWLLNSRALGPYLQNYHNKIGIAMPYKIRTVWVMISGMIFSATLINNTWIKIMLAIISIAVGLHVFLIKTRQPYRNEKMGFIYNIITIFLCWIFLGSAMVINQNEDLSFYLTIFIIGLVLSIPVLIYGIISNKKTIKQEKSA